MNKIKKICLFVTLMFTVCSCANYKNVPYLQNSDHFDGSKGALLYDMAIKPKDKLVIFVFSPIDQEAVSMFNIREANEIDFKQQQVRAYGSTRTHQYLVDNDGNIEYPVLGKIHVAGMTLGQVNSHIKKTRHTISTSRH